MQTSISKTVKRFLKDIFCVVGRNSPYQVNDFVQVLLDAVEHTDFTNNTCVRVGGPTGETVFSRLDGADFDKVKVAFQRVLRSIFVVLKRLLRNRQVGLAFDLTDEPYYGKVSGLWIHPQKPVQGSTGCFKFITVSCTDGQNKLILGNLPVRIGANIVALVLELLEQARQFVPVDIALFDRGFDNYRLIDALQKVRVRYQILWRKHKWITKLLKKMKRGEVCEVLRERKYAYNKSTYKVKVRFVLIKRYKRFTKGKAYNWVFATNTRQKSQHYYVDKYRKRWNIETVFRVLDTLQIKTTTKNPVIRYFINMFCCLVYNLWKLALILEKPITLKNFVVAIVKYIKANILAASPDG